MYIYVAICVHCRCVSPKNISISADLPAFCRRYYSDSEHFINGSIESGLQVVLNEINDIFQSDSYNLNPCVELMENYLCHYYFPLCNQTTGEITPVCRSSCALLANSEDCSELMMEITNEKLSQFDAIGNCLQTFRIYENASTVSKNCLSVEGMKLRIKI